MKNKINNNLILSVISNHINHFLMVKKYTKHDYEAHMILLTVYSHVLLQTKKKIGHLEWDDLFNSIEANKFENIINEKKLTVFAIASTLNLPKETVRRKVIQLEKRFLLKFTTSKGLTLGKNFKKQIEPIGMEDMKSMTNLIKEFKALDVLNIMISKKK